MDRNFGRVEHFFLFGDFGKVKDNYHTNSEQQPEDPKKPNFHR
jgi:hypothetical protein